MTQMEKISVIIPVYNGEKYIKKCLMSVMNQTYRNIEIVVVDDGSFDESCKIINEMMQTDSRIKLIKKKNEGVAVARNIGMEVSTGDYVMFVDADDYIDEDYLQKMYSEIKKYNVDMVCSGYCEYNNDGLYKNVVLNKEELNGCSECYEYFWKSKNIVEEFSGAVVWGKLYKKEILRDTIFEKLAYGEDTLFIACIWGKNINVFITDFVGYYYFRNADSVTQNIDVNKQKYINDMLICYEKICKMYYEVDARAAEEYKKGIVDSIFSLKRHIYNKRLFIDMRSDINYHVKELQKFTKIDMKTRTFLYVYYHFPRIAWRLI